MENLKCQAIVLIYPDGAIETVPITNLKLHNLILYEHSKKSQKFASICQGCDYTDVFHTSVDKRLLKNNVVFLYNMNVADIINSNYTFLEEKKSLFYMWNSK